MAAAEQFLPALVVLLKNAVEGMFPLDSHQHDEDGVPNFAMDAIHRTLMDMNSIVADVLHDFRLQHSLVLLPSYLGWWVLLRSTTWFSQFVMFKYKDDRWIKNF